MKSQHRFSTDGALSNRAQVVFVVVLETLLEISQNIPEKIPWKVLDFKTLKVYNPIVLLITTLYDDVAVVLLDWNGSLVFKMLHVFCYKAVKLCVTLLVCTWLFTISILCLSQAAHVLRSRFTCQELGWFLERLTELKTWMENNMQFSGAFFDNRC